MSVISTCLDYILWPLLFLSAVTITSIGMAQDHGQLYFNIAYFSLALTLFILERIRPHAREWLPSDGQEWADLGHTALTKSLVQLLAIMMPLLGVTHLMDGSAGPGIWPDHWPVWAQVVLGLAVGEMGLYWGHRLAHEWPVLWRFHAVHHSAKKLWFFNTGRFHFVDTFKSVLLSLILLALAGAPEFVLMWFGAITAYIGFLTHCNIRMRSGWLKYLFNTPNLHRWHHSTDLREGNKNYGENLMIWDLLFGTFYDDEKRQPPVNIGIRDAMPKKFLGQLTTPFYWKKFQSAFDAGRVDRHKCM
jgi:sterol desaturase/sphingolipid hydroxylase (fatty acid hydroxylase superfamily)